MRLGCSRLHTVFAHRRPGPPTYPAVSPPLLRSLLIDTYIQDSAEKHKLFNAIDTVPCVQKKASW